MLRVAILFSSILIINASIPYWPDLDSENAIGEDTDFALHEKPNKISYAKVENPLWVLELENGQDLELRPATLEEEENFEETNGILIQQQTTREHPVSFLSDNFDDSVTLYFMGPFTSLSVTAENKQWNYFIPPPSPLPSWFYQPRKSTVLPEEIKQPFFAALWHLLYVFLSHPM